MRRTKDGTLVVIHDDNLKRLTAESGKVSDIPYRELSKMRLLGHGRKGDDAGRMSGLYRRQDSAAIGSQGRDDFQKLSRAGGAGDEAVRGRVCPAIVQSLLRTRFQTNGARNFAPSAGDERFFARRAVSCRDTLEEFDISPEIFACEGGLSRRQVKEAVALAAQQSGFTDIAQALEDRRLGDQDDDHELYHQARFRQLLLLQSSLSPRQEKGKPRGAYVDDPFASGSERLRLGWIT